MDKHFDPKDLMNEPEGQAPQGVPNQGNDVQRKQQEEAAKQQQEEMRNVILTQILTMEARERLNNIKLVKPEKARAIEELLIRNAQTGALRSKVDDNQIKQMLQGGDNSAKGPKITIQRKKFNDSDDDDW